MKVKITRDPIKDPLYKVFLDTNYQYSGDYAGMTQQQAFDKWKSTYVPAKNTGMKYPLGVTPKKENPLNVLNPLPNAPLNTSSKQNDPFFKVNKPGAPLTVTNTPAVVTPPVTTPAAVVTPTTAVANTTPAINAAAPTVVNPPAVTNTAPDPVPVNKKTAKLQAKDNLYGKDKAYWTQAYQDLNDALIKEGKPGIDVSKMDISSYQQALAKDFPEYLISQIKSGDIPLTAKHRKELGIGATSYTELTPAQQSKINDEQLIGGFTDDLSGFRKANLNGSNKFEDLINSAEFKAKTPEEQQAIIQQGNQYGLDNSDFKKNGYKKQPLPFQQTIPELAGFASALNTYNYQTPDYTHWEVTPNKLNIQPQLQSIDSSLNAVNATTTGNPQVDYARKVGAFTQGLAAKQQAYGNKQNYDAAQEFEAQKINMGARGQEQNLDVNAMNTIYNEYMPAAKDAATAERIAAISSLSKKYALNEANENKKKLMIDNFYNNIEVDKDGNLIVKGSNRFSNPLYTETQVTPPAVTPIPVTPANKTTYSDVSPSITRVDKVTTNQAGDDAIFKNAEMRPMKPSRNVYGYNLPSIPNNTPPPITPVNKNYKAPINIMQTPFVDEGVTPIKKTPYKKGAPAKNEFPVRPIRIR